MIVLDDQLSAPYLKSEIEKWYAGSVIVLGFWRKIEAHRSYGDGHFCKLSLFVCFSYAPPLSPARPDASIEGK